MPLIERVRRLIGEPDVIYECRHCGTSLGPHREYCRCCGADDIARYEIE